MPKFITYSVSHLAHGTFIGNIQLESEKPTQVQIESVIHFGASTRTYTLREKPTLPSAMQVVLGNNEQTTKKEDNEDEEGSKGGFLGLPESDTDLKVVLRNVLYYYSIECFIISTNTVIREIGE